MRNLTEIDVASDFIGDNITRLKQVENNVKLESLYHGGNMKRYSYLISLSVVFACSSEGGQTIIKDVSEVKDIHEIILQDTCECTNDLDCTHKADQCHVAKCKSCICVSEAKPEGTTCDDKDPNTVQDMCNKNGECKGKIPSCNNNVCDSPIENCENCPTDCVCGFDQECIKGVCKKVVCGDSKCEGTETCASCPKDCYCNEGQETCLNGKCVPCSDYCKQAEKQCGMSKGCDCGQCPSGAICTELNTCIQQNVCGNNTCEPLENCKTCPKDCACKTGETCNQQGKCEDCVPLCKSAGIECGEYLGCTCGACPVCYKCSEGKCKPKSKDCVCYKKECGIVAGFNCGTCPVGYDCIQNKCLKGCDILCKGIECGWSGAGEDACFCNWCDGCNACYNNKCQEGAQIDKYDVPPYNDIPETAVNLGKYSDTTDGDKLTGSIDIDFDEDWYMFKAEDTLLGTLIVEVFLEDIAEDKDLVLEVCYKCDKGTLGSSTEANPSDMIMESDSMISGARCWMSFGTFGQSEYIKINPKCTQGDNDSGTVWMHVFPALGLDCGSGYTLRWKI